MELQQQMFTTGIKIYVDNVVSKYRWPSFNFSIDNKFTRNFIYLNYNEIHFSYNLIYNKNVDIFWWIYLFFCFCFCFYYYNTGMQQSHISDKTSDWFKLYVVFNSYFSNDSAILGLILLRSESIQFVILVEMNDIWSI